MNTTKTKLRQRINVPAEVSLGMLYPRALGFVGTLAAINVWQTVTGSGGAVATAAHLGGFAAGYPTRRWHSFTFRWHATESAALKAEERAIDDYELIVGDRPPWNVQRGGGGGTRYVRCRAALLGGQPCRNLALGGNYGFCGIHRA